MEKIKYLELLAPAQNKECAIAAINYGADSIYMGANLYGARKNAGNSLSDIEDVINYAHKFNVKIYITLNTILDVNELKGAVELINKLHKIHADGVIIQDFGILNEAYMGNLPDIKLVASTQCDIRTLDKVKFFENIGIKRVILARELSLKQIKEISDSTDIEIETFIHGALCVSYSGQCYLSYKIGGRSANRGECAQACRKKYSLIQEDGKIVAKDKYLLSMKDFMAAKKLEELINAGVTSFKIEGRLKDVNYIKNTVSYYRKLLDEIIKNRSKEGFRQLSSGKIFTDFDADPKKSFNRDFCEYFLEGRKPLSEEKIFNFDAPNSKGEYLGRVKETGKNYFKLDRELQIMPQDGLCFIDKNGNLNGFLVNSVKAAGLTKISGADKSQVEIYPNIMPEIKAGSKIYRNKDVNFENILKNSKTKRRIAVSFTIKDNSIEAIDENKNHVILNFSGQDAKNPESAQKNWLSALQKIGESDFYLNDIDFIWKKPYFLPISEINRLRREILEKLIQERIKNYTMEAQAPVKTTQFPKETGDYRLNVHNAEAKDFYKKCGCNILEYSMESGIKTKGRELMRTKHCIRYALNMCLKNNNRADKLFLKDEKGEKYELEFDCKHCEMVIKSP